MRLLRRARVFLAQAELGSLVTSALTVARQNPDPGTAAAAYLQARSPETRNPEPGIRKPASTPLRCNSSPAAPRPSHWLRRRGAGGKV